MAIPEKQWKLPVAISSDGHTLVSLQEAAKQKVPTLSLSKLSENQRAKLVAARIKAQPKYSIAMIGAGLIDQSRAVNEVEKQTKVGRNLIEIEQRLIQNLLEETGDPNAELAWICVVARCHSTEPKNDHFFQP